MARNQIKRRPLYVDQDSDARNLPDGACRYILNTRTVNTNGESDGAGENVISNKLINNPKLPAGNNKTIGSFSDKVGNTIIYFNYNDQGNHGIFRYYPDKNTIEEILVSSVLNFQEDYKITGINLIGSLLYWTDNYNSPRKINIDKANNTGKKYTNNVYLYQSMLTTAPISFTILLTLPNSNTVFVTLTPGAGSGKGTPSLESLAKFLSDGINSDTSLSQYITAESCGTFVQITTNTPEQTIQFEIKAQFTSSPELTLKVIAENYYPLPFKEEFIERVKYPFECEPSVAVGVDPTRVINLIENKVFQFRAQIYYDDYEKSAWGPVSDIPNVPLSCSQTTSQNQFNYVNVDFGDDRLTNNESLSIIRGVNIAVRELNTGNWKLVVQLSKSDIVSGNNNYKFYNDVVTQALEPADAAKWFDAVGLKVKSQEIVDDRIFDGGITEGYDNVCVDATLGLSYEKNIKQNRYSIAGQVFINNLFYYQQPQYIDFQPIHNNGTQGNPDDIGFGGFGKVDYVNTYKSQYNQKLPLGGFVFYLAGTKYYSVSKQVLGNNPQLQTSGGVYDSRNDGAGGNAKRKKIRDEIEGMRVFSSFSIPGVPPGKYILRIASHLTTQTQLDAPNIDWQQTSTYTLRVGGQVGTECELEVKDNGDIIINGNTYSQGTNIPASNVADLTNPTLASQSTAIGGYVTDKDIQPTPTTATDLLDDTRIELALVISNKMGTGYNGALNTFGLNDWNGARTWTDHNGFFFYATKTPLTGSVDVYSITSGLNSLSPSKYDINGGSWNAPSSATARMGIFRNTNSLVQSNSRTILSGNVSYNNSGIDDVNIVCSRGRVDGTDAQGDWNMIAYVDTKTGTTRVDRINYGLKSQCIATFSQNSDYFNIAIGASGVPQTNFISPYGGTYNYANGVTLIDIAITALISGTSTSTFKRGGKFNFGIVYLDQANRSTFVNTSDALRLQIPFYTQLDSGAIVGGGKPIVSWQIKHLPPEWATHYQWVRTVNGNQGRFLQWTANRITYIDDFGNVVGNYANATQIKISIESILNYKDTNPNSQIGYQYEDGDRLVLIKDPNGNFFNNYYDLRINGTKTGADLILYVDNLVAMGQIMEGTLFEIYNPKKELESQLYYEFGECFEIGESGGVKYHKGLTQDQSPTNPSLIPATGTFRNGDTWVRNRTIQYGTSNIKSTWQIEDQSISDFYQSLSSSIGRPHIVNKEAGQVFRPTTIRFSNKYIQASKINGLSSFEGLNEKQLTYNYGIINKLIASKDVLLSVHENSETVSLYIGKAVLKDLSNQNLVATSESVIGQTYEYQGSLGTQHPESIDIDEMGNVYGYDSNKGIVWKRTNNGLEPISSIDNRNYFKSKAKDIIIGMVSHVPAIHDVSHDQYIISFPTAPFNGDINQDGVVNIQDFNEYLTNAGKFLGKSTFAFNNTLRRWETFFSFVPEFYGKARNNIVVSFLNGKLYRHEADTTYNNFYGTQYSQQITFILNDAPSVMKRWLSISIESNKTWEAPSITTPSGQKSSLIEQDFELLENVYRADLLKDENTPNVTSPLIFGDDLLGETLNLTISNKHTDYSKIFAVNGNFIISETTNQ